LPQRCVGSLEHGHGAAALGDTLPRVPSVQWAALTGYPGTGDAGAPEQRSTGRGGTGGRLRIEEANEMGLRDRREQRRDERRTFRRGETASRFVMRQKLLSFGDDFWVQNEAGEHVFRIDGKALRVRDTLELEDAHGTRLCRIQTRALRIRDTMEIEDDAGASLAVVRKALITPLRQRWKVELSDGGEWSVQGSVADHEYDIEADGRKVAEVSKRWFRARDTYGVQVAPDETPALVLAVTVAVDSMSHPAR
jgi:uncharacterized protein YxjI